MKNKEQLAQMVAEKVDAALKASDHPKKFFITENGRGVVDGGDLYNAVLKDVMGVVQVALIEILDTLMTPPAPPPAPSKTSEKPAKVSTKK